MEVPDLVSGQALDVRWKPLYEEMARLALLLNAKLVCKETSWLMRVCAKLAFFVPDFMDRFSTTLGRTIYLGESARSSYFSCARTIAHELVHVRDYKRYWLLFSFIYAAPQALGLLSTLSLLAIWFGPLWLLSLICLLFLLPIPSPGRTWAEVRAYAVSASFSYWLGIEPHPSMDPYKQQFLGWSYYKMYPFEKKLALKFQHYEQIMIGPLEETFPFAETLRHRVVLHKQRTS
jgi:hypothetical protein